MGLHRWLVWNVLFPLQEKVKGHPTLRVLRELEAAEVLTGAALEQLQSRRLRELLEYAYANVPYTRRVMEAAGVLPSDIRKPSDLSRLPILRKADMRQNRDALRSRVAGKLTPFSTGGSTGEPLLFDLPQERIASHIACRQLVMRWWGLSTGAREFALWGSPVEVTRQDRLRNLRDRLFATRLYSAFEMNPATIERYLDVLAHGSFETIFAYPSSIYLLCQHARATGRDLRAAGIKTVFVTGEVLFPYQRELIAETFNCPVANGYGGRDSGFIAHECPQGGMHVMAGATLVEIVDAGGQPVPAGQPGEIVATDLYSREVPFLRYATGDIGVFSARKCPCGRSLPLMESIEGRTTDFLVAPDGTILHALAAIYVLRAIEGIAQFRIRQKSLDRIDVQVVRGERYQMESEARIREGLRQRLHASVNVNVEYLPSLPAEGSGKFRYVISEVKTGAAAAQQNPADATAALHG